MYRTSPRLLALVHRVGGVAVGLAVLARIARRWGLSAISLYLLAGLAFGKGGIAPLNLTRDFIHLGAEIGVLLLLFMLGLEYSGEHLTSSLRKGISGAGHRLLFNFPPGFIAGMLLGWSPLASVLLGGITLISSSGIIARVLSELERMGAPETPTVLSILVLEDLMMAVYLPLVAVLLAGGGGAIMVRSIAIACAAVLVVLFIATRYGQTLSSIHCSSIRTRLFSSAFSALCCWLPGLRSICGSRPLSAHFSSALQSRARSPSSRTACSLPCAISSRQLSSFSSDSRSIPRACHLCS